MSLADEIYEQVKTLPAPLAREVLDFVTFLRLKSAQTDTQPLSAAQENSLATIWDNEADDVWNQASAG